jgi:hypothetical protein
LDELIGKYYVMMLMSTKKPLEELKVFLEFKFSIKAVLVVLDSILLCEAHFVLAI